MKKVYNESMKWRNGFARFQVNGTWYRSGRVCAYRKPYVMYGFIAAENEDMVPFEELPDDEPMPEGMKAAAEETVMRFFEEGYVVGKGQYQDSCMACVLDGDKYPPISPYMNAGRNPRTAEETWDFYTLSAG